MRSNTLRNFKHILAAAAGPGAIFLPAPVFALHLLCGTLLIQLDPATRSVSQTSFAPPGPIETVELPVSKWGSSYIWTHSPPIRARLEIDRNVLRYGYFTDGWVDVQDEVRCFPPTLLKREIPDGR